MNRYFSDSELSFIQGKLLSDREKTLNQIDYWENLIKSFSDRGRNETNVLRDSQSLSEVENYMYQLNRQKKHLRDIMSALSRIKNDTYGTCKITGKFIDKKRLMAIPTTTKSI